jgi:Ca-activated chloride channel homolog
MSYGFAHPWAFLLLLALPAYALWSRRLRPTALAFSRTGTLARLAGRGARLLARLPGWLRAGAVMALIIALAEPRSGMSVANVNSEGIAIVLAVDISSSMLAEDFSPRNRLEVARQETANFIRGRESDRIGLVAFSGQALTQVPLTIDYDVLYRALDQLQPGMLEDGTAIGTAIATAANRLRSVPSKSKVIILLTDGENNRGEIDPVTAAQAAHAFGIRIYTIGVGSEGVARMPIARGPFGLQYANVPVHIDEDLLRHIADLTGGQYFRATNTAALDSIYHQIDALERTPFQARRYVDYTPHALPFLMLGAVLLLAEWTLRGTRWGRIP